MPLSAFLYLHANGSGEGVSNVMASKESIMSRIISFEEFIELVTREQPSLDDISDIMEFAERSDAEVVWEALQRSGIHTITIALLTNVLQQKIQDARRELGMPPRPEGKSLESMTGNPNA
jgi:hypothetical protein